MEGDTADRWDDGGLGAHAAARYLHLRRVVGLLGGEKLDEALFGLLLSAESMRDEMSAYEQQTSRLMRLAQTGHYVRQLQRLHGVLDAASASYRSGNDEGDKESPELAEWEPVLERERDARMDRYEALLGALDGGAEVGGDWKTDLATDVQQEAVLVLLKAGVDRYGDVLTDRELETTKRAFQLVVRHSGMMVVEVPAWFAMPFEFGGTFGLSRWGNDLFAPDHSDRARFVREAAVWSDLNHPHVAKFLGACHVGGQPFIVHEKVRQLTEYVGTVRDRKLVWRRLYEAALGLQYLGQRGFVFARLDIETVYCAQFEDKVVLLGTNLLEVEGSPWNDSRGAGYGLIGPQNTPSVATTLRSLAVLIVNVLREVVAPSRGSSSRNLQGGHATTTGTASNSDVLDTMPTERPQYVAEAEWELLRELWGIDIESCGGMMYAIKRMSEFADLTEQRVWLDESGILESNPNLDDGEVAIGGIIVPALHLTVEQTLAQCAAMANMVPLAELIQSRLNDVYIQLQRQVSDLQSSSSWLVEPIAHFSSVLVRYLRLLQQMTGSNSSSRIGIARRTPAIVLAFHLDIDRLLIAHRLSKANAIHAWQTAWSALGSSHQATSGRTPPLRLSSLELPPIQVQEEEAAAYADFEAVMIRHNPRAPGDRAIRCSLITATTKSTKLPKWFVPPYEVDFKAFDAFSQGSFGSVHHGKWFETPVVVKQVFIDADTRAAVQAQFRREADVWFQLNHINIVKMYGGCHVGQPFFLCEYASGGDLDSYINHKGRDPYLIWYTLLNAALGLQYLHDSGVAHGDLKANNILVGADNVAKLADFGLSVMTRRSGASSSGGAVGAYRWKAPECISSRTSPGQPATFASDVYSFAMCIIEIVSGDFPWGSVPDAAVSFHVKKGRMPLRPSGIADSEWRLIEHMCCVDPTQRVTVDAVVVHLSSLVERMEMAQLWPSVLGELPKKSYKNQIMSRGGALLSILSLVKSKNAVLANYATSHLFTVHINRGARSEKREIVAIIKMLVHGSDTERAWAADALTKLSWNNAGNSVLIAEAGGIEALVSLLLEGGDVLNASAAETLTNLAMVANNSERIAGAGAILPLVELVQDGNDMQREMAASLLWHLCVNTKNQVAVAAAGAISPLVALAKDGNDAQKAKAAGALWNLAANPDNQHLIVSAGGITTLKALIRDGTDGQKAYAAAALANLSVSADYRLMIAREGGIDSLVDLVRDGSDVHKASGASALWNLSMEPELQSEIVAAGAVAPLVALVRDGDDNVRAKALGALHLLSESAAYRHQIVDAGGIDAMATLTRDGDNMHKRAAAATLLNLSATPEYHTLIAAANGVAPLIALAADGNDGQKEVAAGALWNLAMSSEMQVLLADAGAIRPLVALVRDGNDVQKANAAGALWNLAANPDNKKLIAEAGGIIPLVELLCVGNDVHKANAVAALANLAMDEDNRATIASAGAITPVVEVIRHGNDFQKEVGAGLLWFLCIRAENRELAADAGAVDSLVALIQDGNDAQKGRAAAALWNLAADPAISQQIAEAGGIAPLVALLHGGDDSQTTYAVGAVANLTSSPRNCAAIVAVGAIDPLVALARIGNDDQKTKAASALRYLSADPANWKLIGVAGGISALVVLLRDGDAVQKSNAALALSILAEDADNKRLIVDGDGVAPLVALARGGNDMQKSIAVGALWNFAYKSDTSAVSVADTGGVEVLVRLVQSGNDYQRLAAAGTLGFLDIDAETKATVVDSGGVESLLAYLESASDSDKEEALVALLGICTGGGESVRSRVEKTNGFAILSELVRSSEDKQLQELALLLEGEIRG